MYILETKCVMSAGGDHPNAKWHRIGRYLKPKTARRMKRIRENLLEGWGDFRFRIRRVN